MATSSSRYEPLATEEDGLEGQAEAADSVDSWSAEEEEGSVVGGNTTTGHLLGGGAALSRLLQSGLPISLATALFVVLSTILSFLGTSGTPSLTASSNVVGIGAPPLPLALRQDHTLSATRCRQEFPLYLPLIQRTSAAWTERSAIQLKDVDAAERSARRDPRWGYARVRVHGRQLFLRSLHEGPEARVRAALHLLQRAVAARPAEDGEQPPLELVFTTADKEGAGEGAYWALDRRVGADATTWLMPDFGFAGWPSAGIASYEEFIDNAAKVEERIPWEKKDKRAFWRGFANVYEVRQDLLHRTSPSLNASRMDWADVRETTFHPDAKPSLDPFVPIVTLPDHCAHAFLVHAEGNSYSGRDKFLLSCHAVTISHPLEWEQHFHAAFEADSLSEWQNLVVLPPKHFEHIEQVVHELKDSDAPGWTSAFESTPISQRRGGAVLGRNGARRIADNAVRSLRDRYLTPAATSCYLRLALSSYVNTLNGNSWGPHGPIPAPGGAVLPDTPSNDEAALLRLGVGKPEHGDIEYGVWLQLGSPQWPPESPQEDSQSADSL